MEGPLDFSTMELWMQRIMERFDRQDRVLSSLTSKEIKAVQYFENERLLDNQDLCELLRTSKRTLQRFRSNKVLPYHMLYHKIYYKESDVKRFLEKSFKKFNQVSASDRLNTNK